MRYFVSFGPIMLILQILFLAGFVTACGDSYDRPVTEAYNGKNGPTATSMMVSAADSHAVEAGLQVLRAGGNAVDAAVAVQMVLNVTEPPESGIGGGAFMLHRDGRTGDLTVYDGRETAPAAATADRFAFGNFPLPLWLAIPTGLSVGVPGTVAMLHEAHTSHGQLDWEELFEPAIRLAEGGVEISGRLQRQIRNDYSLRIFRDTRQFYVTQTEEGDGNPVLRNPDLARTFRGIASGGPDYFYTGELARSMVEAARSRWPGGSDLTVEDFHDYHAVVREAICRSYRQWTVCGIPAPSSGGITLLQILGILEHFPMQDYKPDDPQALHLMAEASRLAFADRNHYIGDPDFVDVPHRQLLESHYLTERAALIEPDRAMTEVRSGDVTQTGVSARFDPGTTGTTHFSIVDPDGNIVAMTSSIEAPFGSRIMTNGFLLNNQLTDFDFVASHNGDVSPNAVEGGKRPRSSMAPIIVLDEEEEVRLVIGSRGGSRIIGYVLKALVGVLDWEMPLQQAIDLPNMVHRGEYLELESETAWEEHRDYLRSLGHEVRVHGMESGLHGMERIEGTPASDHLWQGGADSRMDGVARGE